MNSAEVLLIYALMAANIGMSIAAFRDDALLDHWKFEVDAILVHKEYYRIVSSAFVHGGVFHLVFNMMALYSFGPATAMYFGPWNFMGIYLLSMLLANLFALYIHRNHGDYSMVGASGAISGVVFALTVLIPDMRMSFLLLPFALPAWLFGLIFILFSIYGIKARTGNIGHEAHLGGAIAGILIAVFLEPTILQVNPGTVALLLAPCVLFLVLIIKWPEYLLIDRFFRYHAVSSAERYRNRQSQEDNNELNRLLDKVADKGLSSLSWFEKQRLKKLSKKTYR